MTVLKPYAPFKTDKNPNPWQGRGCAQQWSTPAKLDSYTKRFSDTKSYPHFSNLSDYSKKVLSKNEFNRPSASRSKPSYKVITLTRLGAETSYDW